MRASKILNGRITSQQLGVLTHAVEVIFNLGLFQSVDGRQLGNCSFDQGIFERVIEEVRHQQQGADADKQVGSQQLLKNGELLQPDTNGLGVMRNFIKR